MYTEDQIFQNIKAKVDAKPKPQRQAGRTALGFFKQVILKAKAATTHFNLRFKCTVDVAWIETVLTMVKKMDTDAQVKEATLDFGGIEVSPKQPKGP